MLFFANIGPADLFWQPSFDESSSGSPVNFEPGTIEQIGFLSRANVIIHNLPSIHVSTIQGRFKNLTEHEMWHWRKARRKSHP